uniref:NADH-ubiquinone oxidoreductase chain 2 n=1 Tax=Sypharochiton pelliserpentis TaxID=256427 RepID=A0A059UEZ2_9MOLL|nr:NADH dehydrogenase subunit 2 [Sypharochiton pelliserpentis]AHZ60682.1 NADH dehydrogenase subunit 2 [Sypharochiton pelliserpentis]
MLNFPFVSLFIFILFFSSLFSLSSMHWFGVWLGLELNLISFIPLMVQFGKTEEIESATKYFLTQAAASAMLLFSSLIMFWKEGNWELMSNSSLISSNMILFSLLMKLGAAPFHFWVPSVVSGLSWSMNSLLLTWQKVIPLLSISVFFSIDKEILLLLIFLSSMIGGIGGLNQTSIRSLMAYSSILHLGWMMAASIISTEVCCMYFFIYSFILISTFSKMMIQETKSSSQFFNILMWKNFSRVYLFSMIMSMGGMPPMLGFFGKWMILTSLVMSKMYLMSCFLILGSMISLYYYLNLSFSIIMSYEMGWKTTFSSKVEMYLVSMLSMNFSGLLLMFYFNSYM